MDIRHETLESKSILNTMWETILAEKVPDNFRIPSHLERLLPIQRVCTATKEIMTETIKDVLEKEMPADVKDYHVMTRARFHSSLDSQAVKTMVIGVVKGKIVNELHYAKVCFRSSTRHDHRLEEN